MTEVIAVLVLLGGVVLALLGFRQGTESERKRVAGVAKPQIFASKSGHASTFRLGHLKSPD